MIVLEAHYEYKVKVAKGSAPLFQIGSHMFQGSSHMSLMVIMVLIMRALTVGCVLSLFKLGLLLTDWGTE